MNLIRCYLSDNDCYKAGQTMKPRGVMVHSTAANNTSIARYVQPATDDPNRAALLSKIGTNRYGNHWNQSRAKYNAKFDTNWSACVHAFVGKLADGTVDAVQTMPWDRVAWHCADDANYTHISFEICEDDLSSATYFSQVYAKAVELTAMLCKEYGLNPLADGVVICHSEGYQRGIANNHSDVMHWFPKFGKSMDTFRADVAKAMGSATGGNTGGSNSSGSTGTGKEIVKGSTVRVKQGAKTYTGGNLASFVYERDHVVSEISGDRCVITYGGVTVAAVRKSDLTLVGGGAPSQPTAPAPAQEIIKGSTVRLNPGAKDYNGKGLASFVYTRDHVVSEVSGDRCVITYGGVTVAAVRKSDLTLVGGGGATSTSGTASQGFKAYTVKISVTELRIRSGPGTDTESKGFIKPGVYTIVEESNGPGAKRWGKLKSGSGWISLDYATKC